MKEIKQIKKKGFTLIELLIVITIIAILVLTTSSSFMNSQKRSRDASRKSELKSFADALNMYYADKGYFPAADTINSDLIPNQGEFSITTTSGNKVIYMKKVPIGNSSGTKKIFYEVSATSKSFRLYANLENNEDKDCVLRQTCIDLGYNVSTDNCCYILTSSNVGTTDIVSSFP